MIPNNEAVRRFIPVQAGPDKGVTQPKIIIFGVAVQANACPLTYRSFEGKPNVMDERLAVAKHDSQITSTELGIVIACKTL
jgi:hypothetical protein